MEGKARICFVASSLSRPGSGHFIMQRMANHFAEQGHPVSVLTFGPGLYSTYGFHPGVAMRHLDLYFDSKSLLETALNFFRRLGAIRAAIRDLGPDVVFAFSEDPCVRAVLATRFMDLKVVAVSFTDILRHPVSPGWRILQMAAFPLADRVVVQTRKIRQSLPLHIRRKCEVIPNPITPPQPSGKAFSAPRPLILCVANLLRPKGHAFLFRCFGRLAAEFPDWRLAILGEGEERPNLEALARELGIADRIMLPGFTDAIGDWYHNADVFAFPSEYEGLPMALCEALSCGLPAVATDFPSGPDVVVREGENGFILPIGDAEGFTAALRTLMADPDKRVAFGAAGRESLKELCEDRVLARWDGLLADVVGG